MGVRLCADALRGLTLVLFVTGLLAAPAASAETIKGSVDYEDKSCQLGELIPSLEGATVVAKRTGEIATDKIDADGYYKLKFKHGHGAAKAWVRLDGDDVRVRPTPGGATYAFPLGGIAAGQDNIGVLRDNSRISPAGAANIFSVISQGAAIAQVNSPVKIDKVKVIWPAGATHYEEQTKTISARAGREWVPATLLHEFGHHVLTTVADPRSPGGNHTGTGTYPEAPALPLAEGFAEAFAAIALNGPVVHYPTCRDTDDLGAAPATTTDGDIEHKRLAQYNETRVAGLFWHLSEYLGARSGQGVQDGLSTILSALHSAKFVAGINAHNMRQVRDALIQAGVETNKTVHDEIDGVFEGQGMGWGVNVNVMFDDPRSAGTGAWYENHLILKSDVGYGKGGACQVSGFDGSLIGQEASPPVAMQGGEEFYGTIDVLGDLPYTWHDDCLVAGGDGNVSEDSDATILNSLLYFRFPYTSDSWHQLASFKLTARYACANNHPEDTDDPVEIAYYTCTNDRKVTVTVTNGVADPVTSTMMLPINKDEPILEFKATGQCKLANGTDCSV